MPPPESFSCAGAELAPVGADAGAELEQPGALAHQLPDVVHGVVHGDDEAGAGLWPLVGVHRDDLARGLVPGVDRLVARVRHAVLVVQADVEPDGRVEGAILVDAKPRQLVIERVGVLLRGEVALLLPPVGDGARDAVDELLEAVLALAVGGRAVALLDVAVEVLARDDVDRQRAPAFGELDVGLLEDGLARVVLDRGRAALPGDRVEGVLSFDGKDATDREAAGGIGGHRRGGVVLRERGSGGRPRRAGSDVSPRSFAAQVRAGMARVRDQVWECRQRAKPFEVPRRDGYSTT